MSLEAIASLEVQLMGESRNSIPRIVTGDGRIVTSDAVWQEYLCEVSGIVFDRLDDELLTQGQRFECPGCRQWHVAGVDGPTQTFFARPDGELECRALPADAVQRRSWLIEAALWAGDFQ